MNRLLKIYTSLLEHYGYQNWWPITLKNNLKPVYIKKDVLSSNEKFEICVGAILTQNTSWKNVEKAIINLNKEKVLTPKNIINTSKRNLASLIKPSGYYNQKAERLIRFANFFLKHNIPKRKELLSVKGIGPETADSILLYAFNQPFFVIDTYTKRVFSHLGYSKKDYADWQKFFMKNLPLNLDLFKEYHALIVAFAKTHCKKPEQCKECILKEFCKKDLS
jgi:endonuclease-3 related protein